MQQFSSVGITIRRLESRGYPVMYTTFMIQIVAWVIVDRICYAEFARAFFSYCLLHGTQPPQVRHARFGYLHACVGHGTQIWKRTLTNFGTG